MIFFAEVKAIVFGIQLSIRIAHKSAVLRIVEGLTEKRATEPSLLAIASLYVAVSYAIDVISLGNASLMTCVSSIPFFVKVSDSVGIYTGGISPRFGTCRS